MNSQHILAEQETAPSLRKILAAAEREFSEKGFDGAGMKAIALRAEVSQALLHYHFGSKDRLYGEVIRARSRRINARRLHLLETVDFDHPDALSQVFKALFRPPLGPEGGGKTYARIFTGLIVGRRRDQELVQECYDPTAQAFLDAIERAVPGIGRTTAGILYQLALGVLVSVISRDGRMERLMGLGNGRMDADELLDRVVTFASGGARALIAQQEEM